jgi:ribosomal protein L35
MSSKRKRKLRGTSATTKSESKRVARLLCGNSY